MTEYGNLGEILNVVVGVGLMAAGGREAWRDKSNAGARMMGLMIIGMGLLLIK